MGDKRRFELFATLVAERFPTARRIYDIAGGMGKLNLALTARGRDVLTFDTRWKRAEVRYAERWFTMEEPCLCDLLVGMHPDGATRIIVEYAARHQRPFAIVPCCSDNGMSYKPWFRHLALLGAEAGLAIEEELLPMAGRARVLVGLPQPSSSMTSEASPQTDEVYSISTSQSNGRKNGSGRAK